MTLPGTPIKQLPGCSIEPLTINNTPILCVLGCLLTDAGKAIKEEMITQFSKKYDIIAVNQEPPGVFYEYPALSFAQSVSVSLGKPVLYVHTKGAANAQNVYNQAKVRQLWYDEFINHYDWYLNYISTHTKDVVCPFSGINQDTWMNGFIASPYAWSYAPCKPSTNRYVYECMWRGTSIHTEGRIRNDVHEYPSESSLFMCDYINKEMFTTPTMRKKTEIYVAGTDTDKFKHFESIRIPYYVNRVHNNLNIDDMNKYFCELTALYYAWKHSAADIIGLEHYRTYFTQDNKLLDESSIQRILSDHDIIVGRMHYPSLLKLKSIRSGSMGEHAPTKPFLPTFEEILANYNSELSNAFEEYLDNDWLIPTNTFITTKEICNDYCDTLFKVLNEFVAVTGCNTSTLRMAGYMGELFLGAYIKWANLTPYFSDMTKYNKDLNGICYQI